MSEPVSPTAALVTGASAGIGRDLADLLAAAGHDLVLVARDQARLEALAAMLRARDGVRVEVLAKDLSSQPAAGELVEELSRRGILIDVLINNAGFGTHGRFDQTDPDSQIRMLNVNIVALTTLTRLLLPSMLARGRGRIMNVASTAAFQPGPLMAVYYASKAYVVSFSEALAAELAGSGVTVTAVCPGPTLTEFQTRAGLQASRLFKRNAMDSMTVARIGLDAMMKGRRVAITGWRNRILALGSKLAPRRLSTAVAKKLNEAR